jgi:signal transduction histidine kinase
MPLASPELLAAPARLAALRASGLLDSPPEVAFDRLTRVASRLANAPIAVVSLVDANRQFFMSEVGVGEPWKSARGTPLTHSFCQHVVATAKPLIITDARAHPLVHDNLAIAELGVVAYAGMPLQTATGETLGSFCAIDTVARTWTEAELEALQVLAQAAMREIELRAIVTELERVNEYKNQMIGFASHELRTPLNGIMGALQVIDMQVTKPENKQMVDVALQSSRRLLRLINDLLNAEQLESGAIAMKLARHDAPALISISLDAVRTTAAEKGIELVTTPSAVAVNVDADRIVQVIVNLVGNALKFTPPGKKITVGAAKDGNMVRFFVRDEGRGVPDRMKKQIFERFAQVEASDKHEKGGAGLGLAICRAIAVAHGGFIWVEDAPGGGSVFAFTVPAAT